MILSVLLVLNATNISYAKNMVMPHQKHFTLVQKIKWQQKIIKHDQWVIRTKESHTQAAIRFAKHQLKWTSLNLSYSLRQYSRTASVSGSLSTGLPPHTRLWECISKYEGSPTSINPNGHYGMLQMHADWGYGTSKYASNDSKEVQEWAAERAYAASNYHTSFLYGQWFNYDAAETECLKYA